MAAKHERGEADCFRSQTERYLVWIQFRVGRLGRRRMLRRQHQQLRAAQRMLIIKRSVRTIGSVASGRGEGGCFRQEVAPLDQQHAVLVRSLRQQRHRGTTGDVFRRRLGSFLWNCDNARPDVDRLPVFQANRVPHQRQVKGGQRLNENQERRNGGSGPTKPSRPTGFLPETSASVRMHAFFTLNADGPDNVKGASLLELSAG